MFAERTNWNTSPNRIARALTERRASGADIVDLTETNPTRCGFAFDHDALLSPLADPRGVTYTPDPRGMMQTRRAIAAMNTARGCPSHPEQVFLTAGTSEAYSHLFRLLCNPGDSVLVPSPSYPLLDFLAQLCDVRLIPYPLHYLSDRWSIDLDALTAAIETRTRAVIVIHPNNPTGSFITRSEHDAIVGIAESSSMAVIADEVFADFVLNDTPDRLPGWAGQQDRVLTFSLGGASKTLALPQMKISWLTVDGPPDGVADACARLEVCTDTYLSVSTPAQLALPHWLEQRQTIQAPIHRRLRSNLDQLETLPAGCVLHTEGGWSSILRFPRTMPDETRTLTLLDDAGVLIDPGSFYGFSSPGFGVISLIVPQATFAEGIARLTPALGA